MSIDRTTSPAATATHTVCDMNTGEWITPAHDADRKAATKAATATTVRVYGPGDGDGDTSRPDIRTPAEKAADEAAYLTAEATRKAAAKAADPEKGRTVEITVDPRITTIDPSDDRARKVSGGAFGPRTYMVTEALAAEISGAAAAHATKMTAAKAANRADYLARQAR